MILLISLAMGALMFASGALCYRWATRNHQNWMEDGWDHLDRIAETRALTVKDYHDTFGGQAP